MRDSGRWLFLIVIAAMVWLPACEPVDTAAMTLLRQAVGNNESLLTKGEFKVSFGVEGTTVTPWFRAFRGTDASGPFFALEALPNRSLIDPTSKTPQGRIQYGSRGALQPGQGALTVNRIVEIDDVDAFLAVHRVTVYTDAGTRTVVAGRRVVHLRAVAKHPAATRESGALRYDIFVDAEKTYILGITETDAAGTVRHAFEYKTIQFAANAAQLARPASAVNQLRRQTASPAEAVETLGMPAARIFPQAAPAGFPHRRLVKTGALDAVCIEFSNGTSTGIITAFVRKPKLRDVHVRPQPKLQKQSPALYDRRRVRDLILNGRAFVEGQLIGVTYRVEDFRVIEVHTSEKSILVMSLAGLDPLKELVGYFPLD